MLGKQTATMSLHIQSYHDRNMFQYRSVGAKLEVVRQNFRAVSKFHDQNWRIHIQLPKAAYARGSGGMPPQENFEFQFILDSILGHFGLI